MNFEEFELRLMKHKGEGESLTFVYNEPAYLDIKIEDYIKMGEITWLNEMSKADGLNGEPFWTFYITNEKSNKSICALAATHLKDILLYLDIPESPLIKAITELCLNPLTQKGRASLCFHTASDHIEKREMKILGLIHNWQYWVLNIDPEAFPKTGEQTYAETLEEVFEQYQMDLNTIMMKNNLSNELEKEKPNSFRNKI